MRLIAIVGMTGSGKSEASVIFEKMGYQRIRFGDITDDILKEKGLERIGDFSWKKCAENTLSIYKDLIG